MTKMIPREIDGGKIDVDPRGFNFICCDCGLTHKLRLSMHKGGKRLTIHHKRNGRFTGGVRSGMRRRGEPMLK